MTCFDCGCETDEDVSCKACRAKSLTPANTVRVRIAVVVTEENRWVSSGSSYQNDAKAIESLGMWTYHREGNIHFIEADVPAFVSTAIPGKVVP